MIKIHNEEPPGLIFLSHSAKDKDFVDPIKDMLDATATFYDLDTIEPGQSTLDAMKNGVAKARVFILFVSPNTPDRCWVNYEAALAEVRKITNPNLVVIPVVIKGAKYVDAPAWMHRYMTTNEAWTPSDLVREILGSYRASLRSSGWLAPIIHEGRENDETKIITEFLTRPTETGISLNVLILNGLEGIGRRSVAKSLQAKLFAGVMPHGPTFELPDSADSIEWYLAIAEDQRGRFTKEDLEKQISSFSKYEPAEQANVIFKNLEHWEKRNQVVVLKVRWGLREGPGEVKEWVGHLFTLLRDKPNLKLIIASERKIPSYELEKYPNVIQYQLSPLSDESVIVILSALVPSAVVDAAVLKEIASKIHGHPATTRHVALLAKEGQTLRSLNLSPLPIYAFQDRVLESIYSSKLLDTDQLHLLRLLSWFPALPITILIRVLDDRDPHQIVKTLWNLVDFSLLTANDQGNYEMPEIVRATFTRKFPSVDAELFHKVTQELLDALDSGNISTSLIESLLFAVTLSKGELDLEIQKIITPSSLRSLVEKNYELGRRSDTKEDIRNFFNVASKLSQIAFSLPGSKDTLENILFLGGDSLGRSGQDPREFCKKMLDKEYFSAYYIIGSYCYHQEREFDKALEYFAKASRYPHFRRRTIRMLARVNLKTGNAAGAIDALNMLSDETIFRDSGFLAMKIRALRALRNWPEADALQSRLESLDDEYGELPMLKAAQAYRNRDFREAKHQLALARNRPRSNRITLKFLECAINIEEGEFLDLEGTCATAVAVGRSEDAYQLRALKALKQGNWREAETHLEKIKTKSYFDLAAELRMLIMKINDPEVQKDPVILEETKAKRDEGLARSTRAVEDIEK